MTPTAPEEGTIQQLAVHAVGGIVTPAQVLAVLVPNDNALEVEAALENKDIGSVKAEQRTELKTGTRRVIEYFLSPLLQHGQESLRER